MLKAARKKKVTPRGAKIRKDGIRFHTVNCESKIIRFRSLLCSLLFPSLSFRPPFSTFPFPCPYGINLLRLKKKKRLYALNVYLVRFTKPQ